MSSKFSRIPASVGRLLPGLVLVSLFGCATTADPLGSEAIEARVRLAQLAASSAEADTTAAQQLFIRGMRHEMQGDYETAIEYFGRALMAVPNQPAVLMATAEAHHELDDVEAARFFAQQAHEADPDNLYYHRQYAELLLHTGDATGAIAAYQALIDRHPDAIDALFDLARIQTQMGEMHDALATYEHLLELLGEDPEVRTQMLHAYIRLADSDGILATLEAMVAAEPYNTSYIRMLAEAHVQNGDANRAVQLLRKAHDLEPDDFSLVIKLADVYRSLGREDDAQALLTEASEQSHSVDALLAQASAYYARAGVDENSGTTAEKLLLRVLELDPENADAALMLGSILFQNAQYAQAATQFETALEVHTGQMQVWFQAAAAHLQAGDAELAAETAEEALILFPDQPDLLRIAGYAHMERYANTEAISRFDDLLRVLAEDHPAAVDLHTEALSALAMAYDRQQETGTSDSLYQKALELDPEHALSLNNYAYSLAERSMKLDEALTLAKRAVDLEPQNPSFLDTLGWVYFQLNEYESAREWIKKSMDAGSQSAAVYEHYGDVLLKLDAPDEAVDHFESALELGGDETRLTEKIEQAQNP